MAIKEETWEMWDAWKESGLKADFRLVNPFGKFGKFVTEIAQQSGVLPDPNNPLTGTHLSPNFADMVFEDAGEDLAQTRFRLLRDFYSDVLSHPARQVQAGKAATWGEAFAAADFNLRDAVQLTPESYRPYLHSLGGDILHHLVGERITTYERVTAEV